MTALSIGLIVAYLILILLVGIFPGRIRGDEAFLISDRQLTGWQSGLSIAASKIGGGLLVTYSALVFAYGWEAIWLFIGYIFGYAIYYVFSRRLHEESQVHKYYTMADYYQQHFGRSVGVWIGVVTSISLFGWVLTNLMAGGKLVSLLSGLPDIAGSFAIAVTIAVYLAIGGFHAVIRTDILQYGAMIVLAAVISLALRNASISPSEIVENTPKDSMSIGRILSFFLAGLFFPMGSAELWQRTYATKDKGGLSTSIVVASVSFIIVGTIMTLICLALRSPEGVNSEAQAELALTQGILAHVGPIFASLWIIAFASAIMSSADTFVFTTVSALVEDVLERDELIVRSQRVVFMKIGCVLVAFIGVGCLVFFPGVVAITFFFVGITMSLGAIGFFAWLCGSKIPTYWLPVATGLGLLTSTFQAAFFTVTSATALTNLGVTALVLFIGFGDGLRRVKQ